MSTLQLAILQKLDQIEAEQRRVADAILETGDRDGNPTGITTAEIEPIDRLAYFSSKGLNLRPPEIRE